MVIALDRRAATCGALMAELVVAMSVLVIAVIPMAFGFIHEQKLCQVYYQRAVLAEILDGEFEVLLAGPWQSLDDGIRPFAPRAEAAVNLPAGKFSLIKQARHLRLEWIPESGAKPVVREVTLP